MPTSPTQNEMYMVDICAKKAAKQAAAGEGMEVTTGVAIAPVGVLFLPTKLTEKHGGRIPDWIAERPEFKQMFLEDWRQPAVFVGAHTSYPAQ